MTRKTEKKIIRLLDIQSQNSTLQLAIKLHKNNMPLYWIEQECNDLGIDFAVLSSELGTDEPDPTPPPENPLGKNKPHQREMGDTPEFPDDSIYSKKTSDDSDE